MSSPPRDLALPLVEWLRERRKDPSIQWPYHPRSNDLLAFVRMQVLRDLISTCPVIREHAESGNIAIDLNMRLEPADKRIRSKSLDLALGKPEVRLGKAEIKDEPLRKSKLAEIRMSLETKACMTAHLKAIPRLLDELASSRSVVRATREDALALGVVCVNVCDRFTSPLNLPGPNRHKPGDADRVIAEVLDRVAEDYDGLGIVLIDFDNENRIEPATVGPNVPAKNHYLQAIGRVGELYASRFAWRGAK